MTVAANVLQPKVEYALENTQSSPSPNNTQKNTAALVEDDSLKTRFKVRQTTAQSEDDYSHPSTDLREPENLKTDAFYDEKTGTYRMGTKLGDYFLEAPFYMTEEEYNDWITERSLRAYYRDKNAEEYKTKGKDKFDFTDMQFDLGPASKIFGPGGVRIKTQGSAELKIGANTRFIDNPSLSERNRKVFGFDFDEDINLSVTGQVGDKVDLNFNYNTEATFDFDTQNIKLNYEGKEDEIFKLIEAGNVSFPTNSSLIQGATSLFGVRADMQFGKLTLQTVISQKTSSSQTVTSKGGVQLYDYEFSAVEYEENRHFFLSQFFRDKYDSNMSQLPNILSGVSINRIEVWVTNKTGATTNTRNIVAFTDLGEYSHISNSLWSAGSNENPSNASNNLYSTLTSSLVAARSISSATSTLTGGGLVGGVDYEKIESARKLSSSEYTLNSSLGYISLKTTLQSDQVLAVAFEYTYQGQTYQVGEFSTDITDSESALFVKSLKNTANTPQMGNWDLMMKNVYSLGATSVQSEKFRLNIKYLSDTTGVYLSYLPEENLKSTTILKLLGLDRLDNNNKRNPNGYFDFVEGYTIDASTGRIFFPVVEPFGTYLKNVINDETISDKYVFQELYDSTKTTARQLAEKDKFVITGQYKATKNNEISLGSMNIPQGSVTVTAGGVTLTEGTDYRVDYSSGIVTIINQSILDAGTSVSVSLESDTDYGMQRKTMLGLNWQYDFSDNFTLGGTIMHLKEKALTSKVAMGDEPLNNTIWGVNLAWKKESQWLTNLLDKIPILNCTAPSSINFTADFAQLIAGANSDSQGNASYIDDFESSENEIDISDPTEWTLSSVPVMFPEYDYTNDIRYGYNRALLAWYYIDPLFTSRSSSLTPSHIKSDLNQLSDPNVRAIYKNELFPNRQLSSSESSTINMLNLAYYPNERGPYNLDPNLDSDGHLLQPQKRWGGMMRKLDTSDFETANIGYIEFWLMDPFINADAEGTTFSGDLYFNLGDISEDILKDGYKFYESGLPTSDDDTDASYTETVWGRVPNQSTVTYAFNTTSGSRARQDVGFNGLSSADEASYPAYADYLTQVQSIVRASVYDSIAAAPSADVYHYFRGSDYDAAQTSILDRYKYINNPNGNSVSTDESTESYSTAYKTTPDVEDINQDYTLNEYDKYFQYHVSIDKNSMNVGDNFIVDSRESTTTTRNGNSLTTKWYLFRIPVEEYESVVGSISDFSSIRFMRIFMTGFDQPVVLRFASLNLIHGNWRTYEQALYTGETPDVSGTLTVSAVNYEENNEKSPVNYVIPPGISRVIDPSQQQILQDNEQALSLTVENLASGDARAAYKGVTLDLRNYKHLQMFAHANALTGDNTLEDDQVSIFLRVGSDYKNNYYEYEIPLKVTPEGQYSNSGNGPYEVWPEENMLDIDLSLFTSLKKTRNKQRSLGLASYTTLYSEYDEDNPNNKISVMGSPSLGEVRVLMIGVRNNSRATKSVEVWANELRLQEYTSKGGWAAQSTLNLQLSDFASVNLSGHIETDGFGGLEESVSERSDNNLKEFTITTNVEAGRFFPEKLKLKAPLYYSYSKKQTTPRYNPLDTDVLMDDALDALSTDEERDSLLSIARTTVINKNLSLSGIRFNIATKKHPMPYDPANFTFSYAFSSQYTTGETTAWEKDQNWKWSMNYSYTPNFKAYEPFKKIESKSKWLKFFKELNFNYLPQNIAFTSDITREYYELQERDIEVTENTIPITWSSDFIWNRSFTLRWDLTKNLHMSFNSGTEAEIEQAYTAVNKDLYPDSYKVWKDSVWNSIKDMGTPLSYQQSFDASWQLPLNKFPIFDWITSDVKYASTYTWERGSDLDDGTDLGNTIASTRNMSGNVRLKLETLYNHVPFLKKVNRKFSSSSSDSKNDKPKNFVKEIQLQADTTVVVQHNQKNKRVRVTALRTDGSRYPIRYKVLDANKIVILSQDTARLKVTVTPRRRTEDQTWYKVLQYTSRALMMVRNVSLSYSNNFSMSIPGFLPNIGDYFGQNNTSGLQPGLGFAFGFAGEDFIQSAASQGLLLMNDSVTSYATTSLTENLQVKATLEAFRDFKIDLSATRAVNKARTIQYMYDGMPTTQTGSFSMTTISIGTAFEKMGSASSGYQSKAFSKFVNSLDSYQQKVESMYTDATYPTGTTLAGQTFDAANGTIDKYAAEVMIPAFLDTYCSGSSYGIFPTLTKLLPNWSITYSGLSKLKKIKRLFKSFNITHSYKSVYAVGSYSTYSTYQEFMNGYGFVEDVTSGNPIPSSMFDISTVSINESFSPLIGVDMTFNNNLTASFQYRKTRVLTLSMTSVQITETRSNDLVIGSGYKINNLNLFAPKRTVRAKKGSSRNSDKDTEKSTSAANGFSNDLTLRLDLTYRKQSTLARDITTATTEATSGTTTLQISFSAEYALSKYLTLTGYYDRQMSTPLLTSSSYPTITQDFGVTIKFILNR